MGRVFGSLAIGYEKSRRIQVQTFKQRLDSWAHLSNPSVQVLPAQAVEVLDVAMKHLGSRT